MSTGSFAFAVGAIVAMFALALLATVGLETAGRPVGTVVWITGSIAVPTTFGLLGFATSRQIRHDLHNGVQVQIAMKAAEQVADTAEQVAAELVLTDAQRRRGTSQR